MRKRKKGRKLSRKTDQRRALLRALLNALVLREKIETTEAKAKEISRFFDKLITKAKKGDIYSRRLAAEFLNPSLAKKLVSDIAPRYKDRHGGYARIIKLGPRKSDGARMAIIELVK
jgi:large subunit ribosomal protein L17